MGEESDTVAVWDLENFVPVDSIVADMGEILSATVIETFKDSGNYAVVERQRLLRQRSSKPSRIPAITQLLKDNDYCWFLKSSISVRAMWFLIRRAWRSER
jgi:hypothetical protein